MPILSQVEQGISQLFPPNTRDHYFRRFQSLHRVGRVLIEVETIITTAARWPTRPESRDPAWELHPDSAPLVVATRIMT